MSASGAIRVKRAALVASLVGGVVLALASCRDGDSGAQEEVRGTGLTEATPSVTAPISALSHPQTLISANATLNNPTCILPIPHYSSFDIGQKPSEFVEGAIFVGTEATSRTTGAVQLVQAAANTANSRADYWPNARSSPGQTILPVRGLAIDIVEYDPKGRILDYVPEELFLKGRLWVATGRFDATLGKGVSRIHVLAGREGAASTTTARAAVELLSVTPSAIDGDAGEFLTAMCSAPPGFVLFTASQTRVLRIDVAADEAASSFETLADLPSGGGGEQIYGLACDRAGRLYIGRRGPTSFSFAVVDGAATGPAPSTATAFTPAVTAGIPALASPTAISINSADHLVVADRASGLFYEFDATGALVATLTARTATTLAVLPNPPASSGNTPTSATVTGAGQIAAFACDPFISRLVFATDSVSSGAGGTAPSIRAMCNVTFRGGMVPILENRCVFCHSTAAVLGGLDLEGPPDVVRARLLGRACETFDDADPSKPAECFVLPVQNPFWRTDIPFSPSPNGLVLTVPGATCPQCPYPVPVSRVEPAAPTASYVVLKLLIVYANVNGALVFFPDDLAEPVFTNNCAANPNGTLEPGEVCGERCPQASFVQRPIRRSEVDMLEEWIRRGALDD